MATIGWLGGDGDWSTAADWSGGLVPGAADDVTISTPSLAEVTVTSTEAAHSLTLGRGAELEVGAPDHGAGTLSLGGALTLSGGAEMSVGAYGSNGIVLVGQNLTLFDSASVFVGSYEGSGALTVGGNLTLNSHAEVGIESLGVATVEGEISLDLEAAGLQLYGTLTADDAVNVRGGDFEVDGGTLNLGGLLRVSGGTLDLENGVINGGVISKAGGVVQWGSGTLNGVTCYGSMNVRGDLLIIGKGLIVAGAGGNGPGLINLIGGVLNLQGPQMIDNATINMSAGEGLPANIDTTGPDGALTLGADLIVNIRTKGSIYGDQGDSVTNQGVVNVLTGGALTIGPAEGAFGFVNLGAITIAEGGSIFVQAANFTNAAGAVITAGTKSQLTFGADGGSLSNAGTIMADHAVVTFDGAWSVGSGILVIANSTVDFNSGLSTADLAPFAYQNNSIYLGGTLDNDGAVLAVGAGSGLEHVVAHGTISGGTIVATGSGVVWNGILDGVTFDGTLDLSTGGTATITEKGLIIHAADGGAAGLIDIYGQGQQLNFQGTQTFDNATIDIGDGAVFSEDTDGAGAILTFGAKVTINQIGATAELSSIDDLRQNRQDGIINLGVINATFSGGAFAIASLNFENLGTITIANGDTLTLSGDTDFTNLARGVLTGGVYEVEAGSTLQLGNNLEVTSDDAVIILSGAGSTIESFDTQTGTQVYIESTLTSIAAAGVLELLDGRDYSSANYIDNVGRLVLGGGTFATGRLTDASGSVLSGRGVVASTFYDHGDVVSRGVLSFTGTGDRFYGALNGGQIDLAGGSDTLFAGSSLAADIVGVQAGAVVYLRCDQSFAGSWRQSGGSVFLGGFELSLSGAGSVASVIGGSGALDFTGGRESLLAGARLATTSWSLSGDTTVSVQANLRYTGIVSATSSTIVVFSGDTLSLTGAATFAGGVTVAGDGSLALAQATFNGDNVIGAVTVDTGFIDVGSGNLEFKRAIDGKGILELGDGVVVEVDAAASATLTTDFAGAGATLALGAAKNFLSAISGFAAGDTIDLIDTVATGATLEAGDKLVIVDGSKTIATLSLGGDYAGDTFNVSSDGHGGSDITLATQSMNCDMPNVALFAQQMSALPPQGATTQTLSAVAHTIAPAHLTAPRFQP
jgi:fibronectin-binding autotransporter adhesin